MPILNQTRASIRRRLRKAAGVPAAGLLARSAYRAAPLDQQLVRVRRLLEAARLEVAALLPTDLVLRRAICADLDAMVAGLRATSVQAADSTLPDMRR